MLWPTPFANKHTSNCADLWPTPNVQDANGGRNATANRRVPPKEQTNHNGLTLTDALLVNGDLEPWAAVDMKKLSALQQASHAKTSRTQGRGQDSMANAADCSLRSPVLLASWDQTTLSWRTSQLSLLGDSMPFSERWPRSGMTLCGRAYRLVPWVRPTGETEYGS